MNENLLKALREIRIGGIVYGKTGPNDMMLQSYAESLGLPSTYGNPAVGPYPCALVHGGTEGCYTFAFEQFVRSFQRAVKVRKNG